MHFDEVSFHSVEEAEACYRVCSDSGYVMHVSALGKTVSESRETVYRRVSNIIIPKMFYRTDIGVGFMERDRGLLEMWGYIKVGDEK